MSSTESRNYELPVTELIENAKALFLIIINSVKQSDERAKSQ
jgi:hypothetical protein